MTASTDRAKTSNPPTTTSKNASATAAPHTIGAHRQQLNLIGYQIHTLITALTSHHQRTAKPLTEWFGQHQPP